MQEVGKRLYYLAFTERGRELAARLADALRGDVSLSREAGGARRWTEDHFPSADALIFVGAAGIAVRAIAPCIQSKTSDPAVIVIDEGGSFIIPILSGHLGGANELAADMAAVIGAIPVITTATDVRGRFAVDTWAKKQGCAVADPEKIVEVSSKILRGEEIWIRSDWPITGERPDLVEVSSGSTAGNCGDEKEGSVREKEEVGPDVTVSIFRQEAGPLRLIPRIGVLGIGCRKGTEVSEIEACFREMLEESGIEEAAVCAAASIDLKRDEPGLLGFCEKKGWPVTFYSAGQLAGVEGSFSASEFVKEITGVDNVCERSALLASGGGSLLLRKKKGKGVTMALATLPFTLSWE